MTKNIFLLTILNFLIGTIKAQENATVYVPTRQDTLNGSITPERIWWDIQHYDLTIEPNHLNKTIIGKNIIEYNVIDKKHSDLMQIDLVSPLKIDSVFQNGKKVEYYRNQNIWYLKILQKQKKINNSLYSGVWL